MVARRVSEHETRYSLIDPQLARAGWKLSDRSQVGIEIPVSGYELDQSEGITDYVLYRSTGEVLAVVEAKRTSRDARVGKEQVHEYVTRIEPKQSFRPFAFMANGEDIFFWDTVESGERRVAGFFTRENLERLLFLKQHRKPLDSILIKDSIIDRAYQVEAIRRISEAIEKKKRRKALLVMATGTGKTRTIMALCDIFLRAHWAQRVLFLADRDALVVQAETDGFKPHLPYELRARIWSSEVEEANRARICVSTLQTLEQCHDKFSPGDFDLVISDECHRSIYNKYTDILAYFDAIQIGLTATPAEYVDRDTFKFFGCDDRTPTFNYPYSQAIKDKYLADYDVYAAQTKFQRKGVKGVDLTDEEKDQLRERGIDPDDINFEGTDLERKVTNRDTLRRQWEELMDVCHKDASGQLPAKTIIFAITHDHAMRLAETFNEMYPEHGGRLVQVITSKMERKRALIRKFKQEDLPRIAISVDMLDTGFNLPEVMNLAFMKPVNSQIKFHQMIGRGTRHHDTCEKLDWLPRRQKERFLIVDFWENFEHFNLMKKEGEKSGQIPVLVSIFNTRLKKMEILVGEQDSSDAKRVKADLRTLIARIPRDSFTVKKAWNEVSHAWPARQRGEREERSGGEDNFWEYLTQQELEFLRIKVGPLLRFAPDVSQDQEFFISKMERCGLSFLEKKDLKNHTDSIREDVDLLQRSIAEVAAEKELINDILGNRFWGSLTLEKLDNARERLAPLMKYRRERLSPVFELGLDDIIDSRKWVILRKDSERMYVEEYRKRVEARILEISEGHPTIQKLKAGKTIEAADLVSLEETLETALSSDEISLNDENMLKAFGVRVGSFVDFLKHVLRVDTLPSYETVVRKAFDAFILEHNYNSDQSRFLRAVQTVFFDRKKVEIADLYEEPFTSFGMNAVERLFSGKEIEELGRFVRRLAA